MTEERENTVQKSFDVWDTDWLEDVGDMGNSLIDKFDAYETGGGTLKVTIEFYPDTEDEVEDEE
jgi:hypothetical protein